MPVKGKLMQGFEGLDVGDRIRVALTASAALLILKRLAHQSINTETSKTMGGHEQ